MYVEEHAAISLMTCIAKNTKPVSRPPLTKQHKAKRVKWATDYIKCDFSTVIFTYECRATLDDPDGFNRGCIGHRFDTLFRLRRQQSGEGVMFWVGICGNMLIGPFIIEEGVKMDNEAYAYFLKQNFFNWYKNQPRYFKRNASIRTIMSHHMLPGLREIFWLRNGSNMLSLWCGHQRLRTSTQLKTSGP